MLRLICILLMIGYLPLWAGSKVVVFGDSLTAGLGLDKSAAWPALLEAMAQEKYPDCKITNAGVSGDTSAGGLRRLGWSLRSSFDIFILELGANDGLRGLSLEETRKNLQSIIDKVKVKYPDVVFIIAGMKLPPNLGQDYVTGFEAIFKEIASANDAILIPFLLEGVAGVPALNQADGIHPTEEGHRLIAKNVWPHLEAALKR